MTQNQIVVLLIDFFRDEYADDPKGVGYWFNQNYKGDVTEFLAEIDHMRLELVPPKEEDE